jgi:hypothetical protein
MIAGFVVNAGSPLFEAGILRTFFEQPVELLKNIISKERFKLRLAYGSDNVKLAVPR